MIAAEVRALLAAVTVITTVGVGAGVTGIADHVAVAVLIAAGLGWLAVVAARRERRICSRLADPRTRPAPRRPGEVTHARVGPGDAAPVPPAPTHRPGATPGTATTATGGVR